MLVVLVVDDVSLDTLAHGFSLLSPWHTAMPRVDTVDGTMATDDVAVKDDVIAVVVTIFAIELIAGRRDPLVFVGTVGVAMGVCGSIGDISTGGCVGNGYCSPLAAGKAVPVRKNIVTTYEIHVEFDVTKNVTYTGCTLTFASVFLPGMNSYTKFLTAAVR